MLQGATIFAACLCVHDFKVTFRLLMLQDTPVLLLVDLVTVTHLCMPTIHPEANRRLSDWRVQLKKATFLFHRKCSEHSEHQPPNKIYQINKSIPS